jgi:hypothetical protein
LPGTLQHITRFQISFVGVAAPATSGILSSLYRLDTSS